MCTIQSIFVEKYIRFTNIYVNYIRTMVNLGTRQRREWALQENNFIKVEFYFMCTD